MPEDDGGDGGGNPYTICPDSIDASFGSIVQNLLGTIGCTSICHVPGKGLPQNGDLDFDLDASGIYQELLGDGGGEPAKNEQGTAYVLRVDPFHPDASLLYIKLNLHTDLDKLYGGGMPNNAPGTVCPAAVDAVGTWISQGALFAPPGDSSEAGAGDADLDAGDADAGASAADD
jgi:hypothetical protein